MTDDIHLSQLCTSNTSSSGTGWNTIINTSQPRHIYYISIYHISYILPIISSAQLGYLLKLVSFIFYNYIILQYTALKTIFFILLSIFFSDPVTGLMAIAINRCFGIKHVIDHLKIIIISLECHPSHSHNTNNPTIKMLLSLSL